MSKKWLILGSVSFSVGLSLGMILQRDIKQAALTGLLSLIATKAGVSVVEYQSRQKLGNQISTHEKQRQALAQQEAELNKSIALLSIHLNNLKQQEEDSKLSFSELEVNKKQKQLKLDQLKSQIDDLGEYKSSLELQISILTEKIKQLKEEERISSSLLNNSSSNNQIATLDLADDRRSLEDLQKQRSNLEIELKNLDQQKIKLNGELSSLEILLTQLQNKQANLENKIVVLNHDKRDLEIYFSTRKQDLRAEFELLQQDKSLTASSLAKLKNQKKQILANYFELERKNKLIQSELETRIVQKNDLDKEIDRLNKEELELGKSLTELEQQRSTIEFAYNDFQAELNILREQKKSLENQVQQLNNLPATNQEEVKELNPEVIFPPESIGGREDIDGRFNLSNAEDTKYIWKSIILPYWNHRDRPTGYRFLGNVELESEQSDRLSKLVKDELQKRGGISEDLESNLLKIITFVLSEHAYYSEDERFWQGFCASMGIDHSQTVENTLRRLTERGIDLLGLIRATGGYKYVSTLWLQSGIPKQNMSHFATIVQDVADEYGWWELSHSSSQDIAETLWRCWENRYSQWGTIRHFLSLDNSNEDFEPISGQLVKNIAIVARELEYKNLEPETINNRETREDLLSKSNLSYSFFLRDWSDLISVLTPRKNDRFHRIARRRNQLPYLYLDVVDTLNTLLILPQQSLWKQEWQNLRGSYCLIPEAEWEGDIPLQGKLKIPELEINITQAANKWSCKLENHHHNKIYGWEYQGINQELPCLIFDAISGEEIQVSMSELKIVGIEEIIIFTSREVEIELDDNIEIIDNLVPSSIKSWQGKEIRLIKSDSLIIIQDSIITWQKELEKEPQLIGLRIKGKKVIFINAPTFYYPPQDQQITLNYQIENIDQQAFIAKGHFNVGKNNTWEGFNLGEWITTDGNYQSTFWYQEKQWSYRFQVKQEYQIQQYRKKFDLRIQERNNKIISIPAKYTNLDRFWSEEIKLENLYPCEKLTFKLKSDREEYQFQLQADSLGKVILSLATLYDCLPKCDRYSLSVKKSNSDFVCILQICNSISWELKELQIIFTELLTVQNYYLSGWNLLNPNKESEQISLSTQDSNQKIFELCFSPGIYLIQLYQNTQLIDNIGLWCGINPHNIPEEINNDEILANYCYTILDNESLADFANSLTQLDVNFDRDKIQIMLDSLHKGNFHLPDWLNKNALIEKIQKILEVLLQSKKNESIDISKNLKINNKTTQIHTDFGQWCLVAVRVHRRKSFLICLNRDLENKQLQETILEVVEPKDSLYDDMILLRVSNFLEARKILQQMNNFLNIQRLKSNEAMRMLKQ